MLFSVIVPMYNVEKYAKECIESILNQTYTDFELILVDDGSTDNSGKIIDEYAQKDNRIVAIHKENSGVTSARKEALKNSSGQYIVPIDGDDWIDTNYLETFANVINKHENISMICSNLCVLSPNGKKNIEMKFPNDTLLEKDDVEKIYFNLFSFAPTLCTKAIEKDIYTKYQMSVDDAVVMGEDGLVSFLVLLNSKRIYTLKYSGYYYRYNNNSLTKNVKKEFSTSGLLTSIKIYEEKLPLSLYNLGNQLSARVIHDTFNVILSYFRTNEYKKAIIKSNSLTNNKIIKKHIDKKIKIANKKELIAKIALKYKLYPIIKTYSLKDCF